MSSSAQCSTRLNKLQKIETSVQGLWESHRVYDAEPSDKSKPKYFCTFPYPYMNGFIHLGHAFSLTKAEFQARYQRMLQKNVLWPLGFHCTGMPIPACADKLKAELSAKEIVTQREPPTHVKSSSTSDPMSFHSNKSKATSKASTEKTQFEILKASGIDEALIPKFQDSQFWLEYFPKHAEEHLKEFGVAIDWRRSFITTQRNPYYDAFVRWQFNTLYREGYIKFGQRPCIFSIKEQQPCADHERAVGENVLAQEYTMIKLQVAISDPPLDTMVIMKSEEMPAYLATTLQQLHHYENELVKGRKFDIFMLAATLRPETMYGQTNCYVLPDGKYSLCIGYDLTVPETKTMRKGLLTQLLTYEQALSSTSTLYLCSKQCSLNLAYQGYCPLNIKTNEPFWLDEWTGQQLCCLFLKAPLTSYKAIPVLPMTSILMSKGSGIVTSVPSDSADDYIYLQMLKENDDYRSKYGIPESVVTSLNCKEIISTPKYGSCSAQNYVIQMDLKYTDREELQKAKEVLYKESFYNGIMLIGDYKGKKVLDAKLLITEDLIAKREALRYYEPESKVVSRSGDTCIVASCDQWYIDYERESWKAQILQYLDASNPNSFRAYPDACLNQIEHVVSWLKSWACSRHYGLGTYVPWDPTFLIESLSDSTIYMAYYTIAHLLQSDIYGDQPGLLKIEASQLTDETFDYIFLRSDKIPKESKIPASSLERMRGEFQYWYPMDLRVSGKDLIFNHLTMALFTHTIIWPKLKKNTNETKACNHESKLDSEACFWPRSYCCCGLVLVDAQKMSKSKGNFLTLQNSVKQFSADGTRIALADAGDTLDDANFSQQVANSAVLKLYSLVYVIEQFAQQQIKCRPKNSPRLWIDDACLNEVYYLIQNVIEGYDNFKYRLALSSSLHSMTTLRDQYRLLCGNTNMHFSVLETMFKTQLLCLSPIAPHLTEHCWTNILKEPELIVNSKFPEAQSFDPVLHQGYEFLHVSIEDFRRLRDRKDTKRTSTKAKDIPHQAVIYVRKTYSEWQQNVLNLLQSVKIDNLSEKEYTDELRQALLKFDMFKNDAKLLSEALGFAKHKIKVDYPTLGSRAFSKDAVIDEISLFRKNIEFIQSTLHLKRIYVEDCEEGKHIEDPTERYQTAQPFKPAISIWPAI